jgi:hypothetical protein
MVLLIMVITICKLVKIFHRFSQVGDSYYKVLPLVIQSMGQTSLFQSIKIQNLAKSHFSNVDLVWKDGFRHGGQNKVAIETAYIPHVCVSKFLQCEQGDMQTVIEWNISKNSFFQAYVKKSTLNNHFGDTLYGFKT